MKCVWLDSISACRAAWAAWVGLHFVHSMKEVAALSLFHQLFTLFIIDSIQELPSFISFTPFHFNLSHFVELVDWACLLWAEPLAARQPITPHKENNHQFNSIHTPWAPQEQQQINPINQIKINLIYFSLLMIDCWTVPLGSKEIKR